MWTIAKNNYKEIIRDKLLYGILVVALLVTASSFFLSTVSLDQNARVLQNIGLASIHIFSVFIAIFVASNSIAQDFERRTLYLLLPKPISRADYVIGKFLGISFLVATTLFFLGGLFGLGLLFIDSSLLPSVFINIGYSFLEITLLSAIAILFATFTAPLNATLYTLALFIIGHSLTSLKEFAAKGGNSILEGIMIVCYYLLPNLEKFDVRQAVLYGIAISPGQVASSVLYWAIALILVLFLAVLVMKKREV